LNLKLFANCELPTNVKVISAQEYVPEKYFDKYLVIHPTSENSKGVILVVHGLNNNIHSMTDMVALALEQSLTVIRLVMTGHEGQRDLFENVTADIWRQDLDGANCLAEHFAQAKKLPKHFLGFSLGALAQLEFFSRGDLSFATNFKKVILFAPAIELKSYVPLIKSLKILGKKHWVGSKAPQEYRAHNGTPMAAYQALFDLKKSLSWPMLKSLSLNVLWIMDPKDELVDQKKIANKVKKQDLDFYWEYLAVNNANSLLDKPYHHLIVTQRGVGDLMWIKIKQKIESFLNH
jgi:esterase/lipase